MNEITFSEYIKTYNDPLWSLILSNHLVERICHDRGYIFEHRYYDNGLLRFDVYEEGEILFSIYDGDSVKLMDTAFLMFGEKNCHDSEES